MPEGITNSTELNKRKWQPPYRNRSPVSRSAGFTNHYGHLLHSLGSGEQLSRDQLRNLTELADREKLRRAIDRLQQLSKK